MDHHQHPPPPWPTADHGGGRCRQTVAQVGIIAVVVLAPGALIAAAVALWERDDTPAVVEQTEPISTDDAASEAGHGESGAGDSGQGESGAGELGAGETVPADREAQDSETPGVVPPTCCATPEREEGLDPEPTDPGVDHTANDAPIVHAVLTPHIADLASADPAAAEQVVVGDSGEVGAVGAIAWSSRDDAALWVLEEAGWIELSIDLPVPGEQIGTVEIPAEHDGWSVVHAGLVRGDLAPVLLIESRSERADMSPRAFVGRRSNGWGVLPIDRGGRSSRRA